MAQKVVALRKKQQLAIGPCKSLPNSPSHSAVSAASIPAVHINQVRSPLTLVLCSATCSGPLAVSTGLQVDRDMGWQVMTSTGTWGFPHWLTPLPIFASRISTYRPDEEAGARVSLANVVPCYVAQFCSAHTHFFTFPVGC